MNLKSIKRWAPWLVAGLLIAQFGAVHAGWSSIANALDVSQTPRAFDRANRVLFSYVTIENNAAVPIDGPFRLVVPTSNFPVTNEDGTTDAAEAYVDIPGSTIAAGESLTVRVDFALQRGRLTFTTRPEVYQPPTARVASSSSVTEGQTATLHAVVGPTDGGVSYQWQQIAGTPVMLTTPTAATTGFVAPTGLFAPETLVFELTVTDATDSSTATRQIKVQPDAIFVIAGADRIVLSGDTVTLHGIGLGSGGSPGYSWSQLSPATPMPALTDGFTANPQFTAPIVPAQTDFVFEVSFSDGIKSATDRVTLVVSPIPTHANPANPMLLANATPLPPLLVTAPPTSSVLDNSVQTLAAIASGGDGSYTYAWTQVGKTPGSAPDLVLGPPTDASGLDATVPDLSGSSATYDLKISVIDGAGTAAQDLTQLQVNAGPTPPLSLFAPSVSVIETDPVSVSAAASGGTGPYSYAWTQNGGPSVTLTDENTDTLRFTAPFVNTQTEISFQVTATDAAAANSIKTVKVLVSDHLGRVPPQVLRLQALPPLQVLEGASVRLAVGATGGDGNYSWTWSQTGGTTAGLSGENSEILTVTAPVVASAPETLTFEVGVTDGASANATETVQVEVVATPDPLLTIDQIPGLNVDEGQSNIAVAAVARGGTGSYSYSWQYVPEIGSLPSLTLTDTATSIVRFDVPGVDHKLLLHLIVTVNDGVSTLDEDVYVVVRDLSATLSLGNIAALSVHSGDHVALAGPSAIGGVAPYTYSVAQTGGASVALTDPASRTPTFTAPSVSAPETLTFDLTATDAVGNQITSTERVQVRPPVLPLTAKIDLPDSVESGGQIAFNVSASGGTGPYSYRYTTTGLPLTAAQIANPTVTLPSVTADTRVTVTVTVVDSSSPAGNVTATKTFTVQPPAAAAAIALICGNQSSGVPCSPLEAALGGNPQPVTTAKPFALNTLKIDAAGVLTSFKKLATRSECHAKWWEETSDLSACVDSDPTISFSTNLSCSYCCLPQVGDAEPCNKSLIIPNDKLYIKGFAD